MRKSPRIIFLGGLGHILIRFDQRYDETSSLSDILYCKKLIAEGIKKIEKLPIRLLKSGFLNGLNLEDVIEKITIIKFRFDVLTTLLNSVESTNGIKTQIKAIIAEVTTTKVAMEEVITSYYNSTIKHDGGRCKLEPTRDISNEDRKQLHSHDSTTKLAPVKEESFDKPKKTTQIHQTLIQSFFSKIENSANNNVKQEPKIIGRDQRSIKFEPALATGPLTPVEDRKNFRRDQKNGSTYYPIYQEKMTRIVYSPNVYEVLSQKATTPDLNSLRECQLKKLEAVHEERRIFQKVLGGNQITSQNEAIIQATKILNGIKAESSVWLNADETRPNHPPLPPPCERPRWRWDEHIPEVKPNFIYHDADRNRTVYCCRTCFKLFPNGSLRYRHESDFDPDTRRAHFEYYTSKWYKKSKNRRR